MPLVWCRDRRPTTDLYRVRFPRSSLISCYCKNWFAKSYFSGSQSYFFSFVSSKSTPFLSGLYELNTFRISNLSKIYSLECKWLSILQLTFSALFCLLRFQTELSYDFLEVHDGPNLLSPLIGSFNGTQVPQFLFSSSNFLYLLFTTDNSRSNSGFKIFYEGKNMLLFSFYFHCGFPGLQWLKKCGYLESEAAKCTKPKGLFDVVLRMGAAWMVLLESVLINCFAIMSQTCQGSFFVPDHLWLEMESSQKFIFSNICLLNSQPGSNTLVSG